MSPPTSPTSYEQTPETLNSHTPRKCKLREVQNVLKNENNQLKKSNEQLANQCRDLEKRLENPLDEISVQQYQQLSYKFCPSKDLADFINTQIAQVTKSPRERRYSDDFKYKYLSMYVGGPNLYKSLLTKLFCLPGPRTLRKLISHIDISPGFRKSKRI